MPGESRTGGWAAIQGLLAFKEPCEVEITTDSDYVLRGITQWVVRWKRRHWWKKNHRFGTPIFGWSWWGYTKQTGSGPRATPHMRTAHEDKTRCDWLAQKAARTQTSSWADGRAHAQLRMGLSRDYVPPQPQASLFEAFDSGAEEEDADGDPG